MIFDAPNTPYSKAPKIQRILENTVKNEVFDAANLPDLHASYFLTRGNTVSSAPKTEFSRAPKNRSFRKSPIFYAPKIQRIFESFANIKIINFDSLQKFKFL